MGTLWIRNAKNIITMDGERRQYPGGSLYAVDQQIVAIGYDLPYEAADTVIDARDKIVYPGLINTHHHLYQNLTRNIPFVQKTELFDWLVTLYDIWRHLRPEDIYASAVVGLGELLKSGCTTAADHFYCFPNGVSGEMIDEEIRAAGELGIRFFPTRGSMSLGRSKGGLPPDEVCQTEDIILRDSRRLIETYHDPKRFAMVRVGVAPCSPFSITADLLKESAALARSYGVRMHTHLAETKDEDQFCLEKLGMRPLDFMEQNGWVGSDVWYAHGIYFNDDEIGHLHTHQCGVAHCPTSNMKMGSGVMPIVKMLEKGVKVGMGVDGSASNDGSNMLLEVRVAHLLHNLMHGPTALGAEDCLRIATRGSARVLGWEDDIGSLEVGKAADMFMIDTRQLGFAGALHDDAALPVLTGLSQTVDMTIVGGKVVVKDGKLVNVDEEKAALAGQAASFRLLNEAALRTKIDYNRMRMERSYPNF
ncbi:8-oxoguanine deaminase [Cohnella fermenti]|uniref:8-oxoguanine deaminase n=1 Tax=Cohnella fermenti TaxID=2565925 RepID=A0A4S4C127_9BACL|nr:8-oxoguanine deaminase [Cohnella fermenti]THF81320.1 8-oxoguanine deaminase [Cohnella fermenti]